jgi:class 3 adenylate cyclase
VRRGRLHARLRERPPRPPVRRRHPARLRPAQRGRRGAHPRAHRPAHGEAIKEADDFHGKNVILAARIAGEAEGGEILVSSLLKELTESAGDIEFGERREVDLKGLAGRHRVFQVAW